MKTLILAKLFFVALGSLFGLMMLFLIVHGCQELSTPTHWRLVETKEVKPIVKVFMNTPKDYVVFVKKEGNKFVPLKIEASYHAYGTIEIIADVEEGQPMFAVTRKYKSTNRDSRKTVEIHIRSEADLQGGQWETGGKYNRTGRVQEVK